MGVGSMHHGRVPPPRLDGCPDVAHAAGEGACAPAGAGAGDRPAAGRTGPAERADCPARDRERPVASDGVRAAGTDHWTAGTECLAAAAGGAPGNREHAPAWHTTTTQA